VNATPHELLLNHELALSCKIENWWGFLPATGRDKRCENQKLQSSSHTKKCSSYAGDAKAVVVKLCARQCRAYDEDAVLWKTFPARQWLKIQA
jgi:hypothetical protein